MIPVFFRPFVQALYENRNYRFWVFQLIGWGGFAVATFLSITLVDDNVSWAHVGHIGLSAVLGMLTSWLLRPLYHRTFDFSIWRRIVVAVAAVLFLSAIWNVLRIWLFAWIAGEAAIWSEFHYWYYGALSIFMGWTVLYYGITYFELLTLEHQKLLEESALKKTEQLARLQAESSARDAQLQMLRYQLNPHFLFNTLNAINALVKLNEHDKVQEMIQLLSQFLRHTLEQESIEIVPLEQELKSLMLYLNIEKTRFEDRLTLEFQIDPRARQALVPVLILQPIIENSMKYAIETSEEGGTVRVSAHVLGDELQLEVSDTGPGMTATEIGKGPGVGLRNTLERLETLYGNGYGFEAFEGTPSGLTIQIRIPFREAPLPQEEQGEWRRLNQCAS
ncbi:MAG: histidine kinase [Halioglobus sp.]